MSKSPRKLTTSDEEAGWQGPADPGLEPEGKAALGEHPRRLELRGQIRTLLKVFDPGKAAARFAAVQGTDPPPPEGTLFLEGAERLLARMAHDHIGGIRPLTIADQRIVQSLAGLRNQMPNFEAFLLHLEIAARASFNAQVHLAIPPTILVGPPGTGKTRLCRRLSEVLRVKYEHVSMPSLSGGHPISGTDSTWRTSRPGIIAEALVMGATGNPLILLDEIDKCAVQQQTEHPLDVLHDLWEREGATRFQDDCLKVPFDASAVFWVCTANELDDIRPSLLDRAQVVEVPLPNLEQMEVIITSAYDEQAARWSGWFNPELEHTIIVHLRPFHPRLAHRLLHLAMTLAAAHGRREVSLEDVTAALGSIKLEDKPRFGFR